MADQPDAAPAPKNPAPAAKKKKKKKRWPLYAGIAVAVIGLVIFIGLQPLTGTIKYGICRVFIEKSLTYPPEMNVVSVEERPGDVRMEYSMINEFGEYIVNTVTCVFREDPETTYALSDVIHNRQKVPQDQLVPFNATIPFILANPPSLVLPPPMPVDLIKLQRQTFEKY